MSGFTFDPNFIRPGSPEAAVAQTLASDQAASGDADAEKTRIDRARKYFKARRWGDLWILKQQAKYGWDKLGFSKVEAERIRLNKPDWV